MVFSSPAVPYGVILETKLCLYLFKETNVLARAQRIYWFELGQNPDIPISGPNHSFPGRETVLSRIGGSRTFIRLTS